MAATLRDFQIFVKPAGSACNLECHYCYYLKTRGIIPGRLSRMSDALLEGYIKQHIQASPGDIVRFSWHGGEPTLLGTVYFEKIVAIQKQYTPAGKTVLNGIQTNGTMLDENWCRFLKKENFTVGMSIDGPAEFHNIHRVDSRQEPTHNQVLSAYKRLRALDVPVDILCVVHAQNVAHPLKVYTFFKEIGASAIAFLPLVEINPDGQISDRTVPAESFGTFLCTIFDYWLEHDIGKIFVQIFEESAGTAFTQEHELCIFRETCGDVPVIEHNGDVFSCDHFVDSKHKLGNILDRSLQALIEAPFQLAFGNAKKAALPRYCVSCEVLEMCNGACPKDRFITTPEGEKGLNYLCPGYRKFFLHCSGFVTQLKSLARVHERSASPLDQNAIHAGKTGRNDPCPCGSGRKYKKCCMKR